MHKRGDSSGSFILDDSLFGENILEPGNTASTGARGVDPLAPIPVSVSAVEPVRVQYDSVYSYPDQTRSYDYDEGPVLTRSVRMGVPVPSAGMQPLTSGSMSDDDSSRKEAHSASPTPSASSSKGRQINGSVSKRTRRKCNQGDCQNRVVQGGLCISHGAKRKTCGHAGCTKHVKKAGMCSAHGPARKLCEQGNCPKVAVQGGRCIAHGAKKKLCSTDACKKQAILGGMCKKHHDLHEEEGGAVLLCVPIIQEGEDAASSTSSSKKSGSEHRRGLSVFDDMNAVNQTFDGEELNGKDGTSPSSSAKPEQQQNARHTRGLSIFSEQEVVEKIIKKQINL